MKTISNLKFYVKFHVYQIFNWYVFWQKPFWSILCVLKFLVDNMYQNILENINNSLINFRFEEKFEIQIQISKNSKNQQKTLYNWPYHLILDKTVLLLLLSLFSYIGYLSDQRRVLWICLVKILCGHWKKVTHLGQFWISLDIYWTRQIVVNNSSFSWFLLMFSNSNFKFAFGFTNIPLSLFG